MPKRIETAPPWVVELADDVLQRWHPELGEAQVKVQYLMVWPPLDANGIPTGPALSHAGGTAAGTCRPASPTERLLIKCDAIIKLAADIWGSLTTDQQRALLDHELTHLVVRWEPGLRLDGKRNPKTHDDGCPVLGRRYDDYMLTGFYEVARRHGIAAMETLGLRGVREKSQSLFNFACQADDGDESQAELGDEVGDTVKRLVDESKSTRPTGRRRRKVVGA